MNETQALSRYRKVAVITLIAVYFLILVGASVRASGAGMGCPDWPTCFGRWIPPTSESQLPANYQEIYADRGYAVTRFNAVKTWTEYLNRLTGVTIGFLILLTAIFSWPCRHYDRAIVTASVMAFLMVGFQGWLGARVVATNLHAGMITLHMVVALAIVGVLLFALARARKDLVTADTIAGVDPHFEKMLYVVLGLTLLQVVMGTQVREMIDFQNHIQGAVRSAWVAALPRFFYIHQWFSAALVIGNLCLFWLLLRSLGMKHSLTRYAAVIVAVVLTSVASGLALGKLGMPALIQPAHLVLASALFGLQFLVWMDFRHAIR